MSYLWTPCELDVSGDYFYCNKIGNSVYVEIGDVKGHGIAAGLTMTALHGVLWGLRPSHIPLPELLSSANCFLNKLSRPGQLIYASLFMCRIDSSTGLLEYANAGHPHPLFLSVGPETTTVLPLTTGGTLLGVEGAATFEAGTLAPERDDVLFLFTDGVSECRNSEEEEFGFGNRLQDILLECRKQNAAAIVAQIGQKLEKFRGSVPLSDDLALAAVKFKSNFVREKY